MPALSPSEAQRDLLCPVTMEGSALGWWRWRFLLAWAPVSFFAGSIVALRMMPEMVVADSYYAFLPWFNFLFLTLISLVIAGLMARSYLRGTSVAALWLGTGMVILGLASELTGMMSARGNPRAGVALFNSSLFVAGLCQLIGAARAYFPGMIRRATRQKLLVGLAYGLAILGTLGISFLASRGLLPEFWTDAGSTSLRHVVLSAAGMELFLAAVLIGGLHRSVRQAFLYWYAMGLVLLGIGVFGLWLIRDLNSVLAWTGRSAQYVGGFYLLWAVLSLMREGRWQLPLERELQEAQTRYRLVFESMGEGFATGQLIYDAQGQAADYQLLEVNDAFERLTGFKRAIAISATARQLIPDLEPEWLRHLAEVVDTGQPRNAEIYNRFTDKIYAINSCRIARGRFASVFSDITKKRQAEQALRDRAEEIERLLEVVPAAVWVASDPQCQTITGNRRANEFYEAAPGENVSATNLPGVRRFFSPDGRELRPEELPMQAAAAANRDMLDAELYVELPSAKRIVILGSAVPLRDAAGSVRGCIGAFLNITDRKRAEEADRERENELRRLNLELERRVRERTAELALRAAQLRALAGELTLSEQRERGRMARILHDHLQQLLVGAKFRMIALGNHSDLFVQQTIEEVGQLLDESIQASRSLTAELSPPILHEAGLNAGLEWLARWMRSKHGLSVELSMDPPVPLPEDVKVLLFESVRELLFNVVKHSQTRSATVALRHGAGDLQVMVSDPGCGFDVQSIPQAGIAAAGFGLFTIRERLELMGGRLEVHSAAGKGSRCLLTVPLDATSPTEPPQPLAPIECPEETSSRQRMARGVPAKIRLLLADDHVVMREGLAGLLEQATDIEIIGQAADGQEAVELATRLRPDVILMDISMPRLNGVEATRIIHRDQPEIRIIGLSMFDAADRAQAMREAGAVNYVIKSGPPEDLFAAIRECMTGAIGS